MRVRNKTIRYSGQAAIEYVVCLLALLTTWLILPDDFWAVLRQFGSLRFQALSSMLGQP